MTKIEKVKNKKVVSLFIVLIIFTIVMKRYGYFTGTICLIRGTIGIPCPACGITRAYKSFFQGDLIEAFEYHPLFILPLLLVLIFIIHKSSFKKSAILIGGLFIIVYLLRMYLYFPDIEPLKFNNNALMPRVVEVFLK